MWTFIIIMILSTGHIFFKLVKASWHFYVDRRQNVNGRRTVSGQRRFYTPPEDYTPPERLSNINIV